MVGTPRRHPGHPHPASAPRAALPPRHPARARPQAADAPVAPARPAGPGVPRLASRGGWGGWGAQGSGSRALRAPARPHLDVEVRRVEAARRDEPSLGGPQVLRHQLAGSLHQKLAVALGGHDAARARRTSGRGDATGLAAAGAATTQARSAPSASGFAGGLRACACGALGRAAPRERPDLRGGGAAGSLSAGSGKDPPCPRGACARAARAAPRRRKGGGGPRTVPGAPRPGVTGGVDAPKGLRGFCPRGPAGDRAAVRTFHVSLPPRVYSLVSPASVSWATAA